MSSEEKTVTCPRTARFEGDIVGCGTTFTQAPDDEGVFDCPVCGVFFTQEASEGGSHAN